MWNHPVMWVFRKKMLHTLYRFETMSEIREMFPYRNNKDIGYVPRLDLNVNTSVDGHMVNISDMMVFS